MKTKLLYWIPRIIAILILIIFLFFICKYANKITEISKNVFMNVFSKIIDR